MTDDCPAKPVPPPLPPAAPYGVQKYWEQPLHELHKVDVAPIEPECAERHRIYSLLTMALIHGYWNGNKSGADGTYPWRESQKVTEGRYRGDARLGDRYIGHNIAGIAVDENGELIDFDFNHNELYNSSAEHAESRLIRRIFSLNQLYDHWQTEAEGERKRVGYNAVFTGTTIYTSLESCAQCSGVMTLANAKRVVYLQTDPGQYFVGNILYNLSLPQPKSALLKMSVTEDYTRPSGIKQKYFAPEPVDASLFGFEYKAQLESAYLNFAEQCGKQKAKPFFVGPGPNAKPYYTDGITSFLCTDEALAVFTAASAELQSMVLSYPDYAPTRSDGQPAFYTNAGALVHVKMFLAHALNQGHRATPHR